MEWWSVYAVSDRSKGCEYNRVEDEKSNGGFKLMGMGTAAYRYYVIEYEELKKLCPTAIENIEKERFFESIGWLGVARSSWPSYSPEEFCDAVMEEYGEDSSVAIDISLSQAETFLKRYEKHIRKLKKDFQDVTGLGLELWDYNRAAGDRYVNPRDKDGCIFVVEGMTQLTPAGKKGENIVFERSWIQYG